MSTSFFISYLFNFEISRNNRQTFLKFILSHCWAGTRLRILKEYRWDKISENNDFQMIALTLHPLTLHPAAWAPSPRRNKDSTLTWYGLSSTDSIPRIDSKNCMAINWYWVSLKQENKRRRTFHILCSSIKRAKKQNLCLINCSNNSSSNHQ